MSDVARVHPAGIFDRMTDGKRLYSQVVTAAASSRIVFVSGQIARDERGEVVGKGDMRAQMVQVIANLEICLKAAGASLRHIVKMTTFVTDITEFANHADLRAKYFGDAPPASSTVEVSRLAGPDYLIEIEAIAVID